MFAVLLSLIIMQIETWNFKNLALEICTLNFGNC